MNPLLPFSGWCGPRHPRMLLLGEAWGASEEPLQTPFVGHSGKELFRMLGDAKVAPGEAYATAKRMLYAGDEVFLAYRAEWLREAGIAFTNVFNLRPSGNKLEALCGPEGKGVVFANRTLAPLVRTPRHLYMRPEFTPHLTRLREEVCEARVNLVVALGAAAMWGLTAALRLPPPVGTHSEVRGTIQPGPPKFLATFHPAFVLRQWSVRSVTVSDLIKAWRESATGEFIRPARKVLINPELEDLHAWLNRLNSNPPPVLSCDIETKGGQITSIAFANAKDSGVVVPFVKLSEKTFTSYWMTASDEAAAWRFVREVLSTPYPKVFQNGLYDIQWLLRRGIRIANVAEDTMLLHHAIHPEMRKGLGFLGSLYTNEMSWKLMRRRGKDEGEKAEE